MKILLVNRHMNIGGVETYLYRLCSGLCARGHEVGLLTEGGLYESMAADAGARLHKVSSLARSWPQMLPKLREAGYALVHAHNYHSARVGQSLAQALRLPYLMSVHGPRPRLKQWLFRAWSRPVVVMSEGDRDNIAWWGGVPRKDIHLSFYGIDTSRFHPGLDVRPQLQEFQLLPGTPILAFVSRFSNRKAEVGQALLEALPTLRLRYPTLQLLLVGEGPEAPRLFARAEALNRNLGERVALPIGPRKDVQAFLSLASLAVCTANTALEALACGTPTLAAGRTGYFGLVNRSRFEAARSLCFGDHGQSPESLSASCFLRDVPPLLDTLPQTRAEALEVAHLIEKQWGIAPMAGDMEALYQRLLGL